MTKIALRKAMKNIAIDMQQKALQESKLIQKLISEIFSRRPSVVGLFAALPDEIDLSSIFPIKDAINTYPKVNGEHINFHKVLHLDELSPQPPYNICEPSNTAEILMPDLVIVPGLAFTEEGTRLGRGKGYYDKYLSKNKCFTIALAFSWQLLPQIPKDDHDVTIDLVITDD